MTNLQMLLIDDNPDDRTLALRELEREFSNIQVTELTDHDEFLQALNQQPFNFVITDYRLRWSNGLIILKEVKEKYPDCPVIMFTGTGSEEVAVEAMKAGLDDYVIKSPKHYVRLATAVRSVWERYQQRQALKDAENRYRRLFEGLPIGLYRISHEGEVLEANPTLIQMLGYSTREELSKPNIIDLHIDLASRMVWQEQMQQNGIVQNLETPLCCQDETMIWVRHSARAVFNEKGNILYYEGAVEDISERKRTQEELARLLSREQAARADAEAANRIKDEFLATLSHELRTPLNSMLGWVQLMRGGKLSATKVTQALEIVERNVRTQTQLVEDLLDVSRIIRGKMQLKLRSVNLNNVIGSALDTVRPAAEAKSITLKTPDADAEIIPIHADPDRLQQVIWNLLANAIKFTPNGGTVAIELETTNQEIEIRVTDTGIGLEAEFLVHIFERFRQVDNSTKRSHGGLGLGLAIVRHLVELHGGTVHAESAGKGKGTTFIVKLPIPRNKDLFRQNSLLEDDAVQDLPQFAGLNILVVEDEPDARELLKVILEQCGATVEAVSSVKDALIALNRRQPDILISDISMPEADGYDLIEAIRNQEGEGRQLPAIALTAYASERDRERCLAAGFQVHLSKPIDPTQLTETLTGLIQKSKLGTIS